MTTTFHFETNEPQYEYSYEGADLQLRYQGLVAVAAGPAPAFEESATRTWFELSPVSGKRILAGVGRSTPSATAASAFETKETMWANAMAGLPHSSSPKRAPPLLTVSMPWSTRPLDVLMWGVKQRVRVGRRLMALRGLGRWDEHLRR